jgi:dTDP-4-amino-4,6-dideoxygalactose transaminase
MSTQTFPFFDITRQFQEIKPEVMATFEKLLDHQHLIGGSAVVDFEKSAAEWMGVKHAVTCASGTDALIIALKVAGVEPGDEVITPSYSFFASTSSIAWIGATPVWADVRPDTYCIDVKEIEKKITPKTKAIMAVHLYGQTADMDAINALAKSRGLKVIEDCAQAIGAKNNGKQAGGLGDICALSFYPTKNLGGAGDGGLVTSNNDDFGKRALLMRQHGMPKRYTYDLLGFNSRLDSLQCAYLHIKLKHLKRWNERRNEIAKFYIDSLKPLEKKGLVLPYTVPGNYHVFHQFMVRVPNRDQVKAKLGEMGIPTDIYYPKGIPDEDIMKKYKKPGDVFPVADECSKSILALPIFPELTKAELEKVVDGFHKVV